MATIHLKRITKSFNFLEQQKTFWGIKYIQRRHYNAITIGSRF